MDAKIKMSFNNRYHVELIDSSTGKVKQSGDFHNLVVNNFLTSITCTPNQSTTTGTLGGYHGMMHFCAIGNAVNAPSSSDTSISTIGNKVDYTSQEFEWLDNYTGRNTCVYTFPANSTYVGTVTEIGLYNTKGLLTTHALLTDSEGQQISFEKTDLDILEITVSVELTLNAVSNGFKLFNRPGIVYNVLYTIDNSDMFAFHGYYGYMNLVRFYADLEYDVVHPRATPTIDYKIEYAATNNRIGTTGAITTNTGFVEYPAGRVPSTEVTSERYYKAIAVPGIGYWKLPNEDIFPTYNISGIPIGTGNGSTTQFNNPLSYFKANTDKVYKNGVMLTRGVDYTISNIGNALALPELSDFIAPTKVLSNEVYSGDFLAYLIEPSTRNDAALYNKPYAFSNANPLYIEYNEDITFNCLKCTNNLGYYANNRRYTVPTGTIFYVDYSLDGEVYVEVGSTTLTSGGQFICDFPDTAAKYWRIRTSLEHTVFLESRSITADSFLFFCKKDPYITFNEAPAEGDVLTMDVGMDIIMKNSNFVVESGCRFDFTL